MHVCARCKNILSICIYNQKRFLNNTADSCFLINMLEEAHVWWGSNCTNDNTIYTYSHILYKLYGAFTVSISHRIRCFRYITTQQKLWLVTQNKNIQDDSGEIAYIHAYMHTYIHTYIHTHTHTHTYNTEQKNSQTFVGCRTERWHTCSRERGENTHTHTRICITLITLITLLTLITLRTW